ncbi:MAG TPA: hypothetical protein VFP98_06150, partial [Candidatus Polarisedimenticolia bacterium]|nr:hypothetical protein [Candidatus Polarisedimenticolia bacterium]
MNRAGRRISPVRSLQLSAAAMLLLAAIHAVGAEADSSASLEVQLGVAHDGGATGQWLAMLRKRLPESQYAGLAGLKKPLSGAEQAWADLILSKIAAWETRRAGLVAAYSPVDPPQRAVIVLGNRGGDDAFTHDPTTIGFDLSILQSAYGDAVLPENTERIDRLFDHEYTHLLQKAWLRDRPYRADSPLRAALLDIWLEGLGNHRSMSGRWRSSGGRLPQSAMETLAVLEPRFVARLAALACASPEQAPALMADLSRGSFQS